MKTESPTEARLETLREEGIVPISAFTCHAVGVSAGLVAVSISLGRAWSADPDAKTVKQLALTGIVYPICAYVIFYFAAALLQSRGFFRVVFSRTRFGERDRPGIVAALFFLSLGVGLFYWGLKLMPAFAAEILKGEGDMVMLARKTVSGMRIFAAAAGASAAVSAVLYRIIFLRARRMTREEIMRESRQ